VQEAKSLTHPVDQHTLTTRQLAAQGLIWLEDQAHCERWHLSRQDISGLLGGVDLHVHEQWLAEARAGGTPDVPQDVRERLAILLKIDCLLAMAAPAEYRYLAFNLPTTPHSLFGGESIRSYLIRQPHLSGLHYVQRYLHSCR